MNRINEFIVLFKKIKKCYCMCFFFCRVYITIVFQRSLLKSFDTTITDEARGKGRCFKLHGSKTNPKPRGSKPKANSDASNIVFNVSIYFKSEKEKGRTGGTMIYHSMFYKCFQCLWMASSQMA